MLRLAKGGRVIDSGCGYAWTTEWLFRSGFDPIGVDICRTYLEVGLARMGVPRPHLVIGDVEALPLRNGAARAVLAYESFHHIPNRPRAVRAYERVIEDHGVVILAEPGAAHEHAPVAIDAMRYGILEKGMELADVQAYCDGTTLRPEQLFMLRLAQDEIGAPVNRSSWPVTPSSKAISSGSQKGGRPRAASPPPPARPGFLSRVQHRLRAAPHS
jgi:SAM-dependent methyltransferase